MLGSCTEACWIGRHPPSAFPSWPLLKPQGLARDREGRRPGSKPATFTGWTNFWGSWTSFWGSWHNFGPTLDQLFLAENCQRSNFLGFLAHPTHRIESGRKRTQSVECQPECEKSWSNGKKLVQRRKTAIFGGQKVGPKSGKSWAKKRGVL